MKRFLLILFTAGCCTATAQSGCDSNRLPVVLVHGFLASGDTWAVQAQRFYEQGYCRDRIYAFDWNTTGGKKTDSLLHQFIEEVLQKTGATQIDLAGHSAGGGLCYRYLQQPNHAALVAHYAHIGSNRITAPAGDRQQVPTLLIRSSGDRVIRDTASTRVPTLQLKDKDHLQVATSAETFRELFRFFTGNRPLPPTNKRVSGKAVQLAGRLVTMGDNEPQRRAVIQLYQVDSLTGHRISSRKALEIQTDDRGNWGPVSVPDDSYLEMETVSPQGRTIRYFFEPFRQDNSLVYLRTLPATGLGAMLLKKLPAYPDRSSMAVFCQSAAMIAGRDSLRVNGYSLCTPSLAPPEATVIASFIFDDGDGISSGRRIKDFGAGIFLNAADLCVKAPDQQPVEIYYNGRYMRLPAIAGNNAILVAVFQ